LVTLSLSLILSAHSQFSRSVHWIRDDTVSAVAFGIPINRLQIGLFAFHAGISAIVGMSIVVAEGYVSPKSFDISLSLTALTAVYLSGTGGHPIAMISGAAIVVILNEGLRAFGQSPELVGPIQEIVLNAVLIGIFL